MARRYWRDTLIDTARCLPAQLDLAVSGGLHRLSDLRAGYLQWVGAAQRFTNANFFGGYVAEGLMKDSGSPPYYSTLVFGRPCLMVERGVATIYSVESLERAKAAHMAVGGGPVLLRDGQRTAVASLVSMGQLQDIQPDSRRPRNVIGIMHDGTIWQAGTSPLTLAECQQVGVDFGLRDLMNLDGGDSMGAWEDSLTFGKAERRIVSALVMRRLLSEPLVPHGPPYHRLSDNFHGREFYCKCCGQVLVSQKLVALLERIRTRSGNKPVSITHKGGCRCSKGNAEAGGAPNSRHLFWTGRPCDAADIQIAGVSPAQIAAMAEREGADGIGIYATFTHVDMRGYRARW